MLVVKLCKCRADWFSKHVYLMCLPLLVAAEWSPLVDIPKAAASCTYVRIYGDPSWNARLGKTTTTSKELTTADCDLCSDPAPYVYT